MLNISWELLSTKPSYLRGTVGILPDILNTLYIILSTLLFVLSLGVRTAIYLTEYATNKRLIGMIEYAADTLSGIPSIIYGLFGSWFFCQFMDLDKSLLAGGICAGSADDCQVYRAIGDHCTNIAEWVEFSVTGVHRDCQ